MVLKPCYDRHQLPPPHTSSKPVNSGSSLGLPDSRRRSSRSPTRPLLLDQPPFPRVLPTEVIGKAPATKAINPASSKPSVSPSTQSISADKTKRQSSPRPPIPPQQATKTHNSSASRPVAKRRSLPGAAVNNLTVPQPTPPNRPTTDAVPPAQSAAPDVVMTSLNDGTDEEGDDDNGEGIGDIREEGEDGGDVSKEEDEDAGAASGDSSDDYVPVSQVTRDTSNTTNH